MTSEEDRFRQSKEERINRVFGAGTVSRPDLRPGQSPGRKHPQPRMFFLAVARGESELPSRADRRRHRLGRSHPTLPVRLQVHSLRQPPRRSQFACQASGRCGQAVRRIARSLPTRSGRCAPAQRVLTESRPRVETVRRDRGLDASARLRSASSISGRDHCCESCSVRGI